MRIFKISTYNIIYLIKNGKFRPLHLLTNYCFCYNGFDVYGFSGVGSSQDYKGLFDGREIVFS